MRRRLVVKKKGKIDELLKNMAYHVSGSQYVMNIFDEVHELKNTPYFSNQKNASRLIINLTLLGRF